MEVSSILKIFEKEFGSKFTTREDIVEEASKSPYLVSPILSKMGKRVSGVILAEDEEDIFTAVKVCDNLRVPLLARGAGTTTIGQVLPIKESTIVLGFARYKEEIEIGKDRVKVTPSVKVLKALEKLRKAGKELRVYPSSFYISTLGGYIAGGDVGIGSYQYGYHFDDDGIKSLKIIGPTGRYELKGKDTLGVAQAAGTTGIIYEAELSIVDNEGWRDQLVSFDEIEDVGKYLKGLEEFRSKIRRITVEDFESLSLVSKGRLEKIGKWNVLISSTLDFGEEVNLKFLDELAFAAVYVTMSKLTNFKDYFYEVRLLPLSSFSKIVRQVKEALRDKVLIHGDVMTLRGETIIYTVFISDKENFGVIDNIMMKEGIPFEIHSIEVNYRVDEEFRLEMMKKFKRLVDPHDILNPGKLIF